MGLSHVVITSVDRDDLGDGGARHFADVIQAIRQATPATTIEILTPDFLRKDGALEIVVAARPDVFNHNLETVPSNYLTVRPGARYFHSIRLLQRVKELDPSIFTKSGIMVGLGEERNEVIQLMDDLRSADVDFITIGQYLQPSKKHHPVRKFVTPEEFKSYETIAYAKGFLVVASSPLTRSSHHAGDDFAKLRAARESLLNKVRVTHCFHAAIRNNAPCQARAGQDVRAGRRHREISRIPAALHGPDGALAQGARRPHAARRRHERRLQGDPRDLHHPGLPQARRARHRGEIHRRSVPLSAEQLALRGGCGWRLATCSSSSTTNSRAASSAR